MLPCKSSGEQRGSDGTANGPRPIGLARPIVGRNRHGAEDGVSALPLVYLEQQPGVRHVSCSRHVAPDTPMRAGGAAVVLVVALEAGMEARSRLDHSLRSGTVVAVRTNSG